MKQMKRLTSIFLALALVIGLILPVSAAEITSSTEKEENVYITLDASGAVKGVYVVNSFAGGDITDYGDYDSVKLLNTTDVISQDGDTVTFTSSADKVYYQGELSDVEIPWIVSIRYFLDGVEYTADEIAGESGALEIRFSVEENTACDGSFFDNYAVQVNFTLDTNLCSNIQAADASIANVGSDKQLSYIILPGEGIETTISADVTDFEMDAVSLNGIQLNLSIDVDDEDLLEQITDLLDAIVQIDDGTGEVKDGVEELQDAAQGDLADGVDELADGAAQLSDGAGSLADGGSSVASGAADLADGAASLDAGVPVS